MSAKFCPNCGTPLEPNAKFCGKCGTKIEVGPQPTVPEKAKVELQKTPVAPIPNQPASEPVQQRPVQQTPQSEPTQATTQNPGVPNFSNMSSAEAQNFAKAKWEWYKQTYLTAQGRLNRLAYLKYALLNIVFMVVGLIAVGIIAAICGVISEGLAIFVGVVLAAALYIPLCIGGIMLSIRRVHDFNLTGWSILLNFVPYVNVIWGFVVLLVPGTTGKNSYGPDPLAGKY